ncbi:unnamed protein product [Prorocentrum cordatum]|uniref:Acyltransferase n=1 Tax=Prorocentrum cordatum TaxID=2364126 RepID=A0ABN9XFC7_9DINO|nr:unnamed protein product [Polarella glacialis]
MTGQSRNAANPFVHTWSLGIEEHFYLLFPVLVLLAHGRRVVASAGCRPPWPASLIIFGAFAALSGCASRVMTVHAPDMAFYLLPARFWELAVGAILADAHAAGRLDMTADGRSAAVVGAQDLVATLLIASSLVLDTVSVGFPFPGALLPVAGAACVIVAGRSESSALRRVLGQELPVYIGKLSYPLYLWHWPVLKLADGTVVEDLPVAWRYFLLLSVMLALASATYHVVEGPFRSWRPRAHWHAFAVLLPAAVVLAGCMLALRGPLFGKLSVSAGNSLIPSAATESTSSSPGDDDLEHPAPTSHALALTGCACGRVPEFTHAPATANDGRHGQPCCLDMSGGTELDKSCWAVYYRCSGGEWCDGECELQKKNCTQEKRMDEALTELFDRQKRQCLSPATGSQRKPTLFLLGDSHALFFKHALTQAVGGRFDVRSWASVHFIDGFWESKLDPVRGYPSKRYHSELRELIADHLVPGDIVAIGLYIDGPLGLHVDIVTSFLNDWVTIADNKSARVLMLGDHHSYRKYWPDVPTKCGNNGLPADLRSHCFPNRQDVMNSTITLRLRELQRTSSLLLFEYRDLFCHGDICMPFIPGSNVMAYEDASHLTPAGSRYVAPFLCEFLKKHGLLQNGSGTR